MLRLFRRTPSDNALEGILVPSRDQDGQNRRSSKMAKNSSYLRAELRSPDCSRRVGALASCEAPRRVSLYCRGRHCQQRRSRRVPLPAQRGQLRRRATAAAVPSANAGRGHRCQQPRSQARSAASAMRRTSAGADAVCARIRWQRSRQRAVRRCPHERRFPRLAPPATAAAGTPAHAVASL
jgi:hypothetical protein